jgi:retron-type reverse transcriptase
VEYDGKPYWVAVGPRALPQGACTSPALSNQVTKKLDRRLSKRLGKAGWTYTRYADDLTFSAKPGKRDGIGRLHAAVRHTLEDEGFTLHPKKGRFLPKTTRQMVTGVVVNAKVSVRRDEVRRLRAILHQAKKTGLEAQNREKHPDFERWLRGKIAWVHSVDPAKGAKLLAELEKVKK